MSAACDSGNMPPFCNDSYRIAGFSTWKWVGFLLVCWFFFFERREGRRRGAGLCNQYFLCDNSYLVFSQEGVHRNAL